MDDTQNEQNVQKEELDFLKDMNEKLIEQMEKLAQEKSALAEKLKEPEQVPGLRAKIQKLSDDQKQLLTLKDRICREAERTKADLTKEVEKLRSKVKQKSKTIDDLIEEMSKEGKSAKELRLNTKKETDELKKKVGHVIQLMFERGLHFVNDRNTLPSGRRFGKRNLRSKGEGNES